MATWSSNVLLGVCDAPCTGLELSPFENKIGGYPDLFPTSLLASLPCCSCCGGSLQLLVQVYCPLEASVNHRLIHLYCCTVPDCHQRSDGWLALRSELRDSTLTTDIKPGSSSSACTPALNADSVSGTGPGLSEWCDGAEDWGEESKGREELLVSDLENKEISVSEQIGSLQLSDTNSEQGIHSPSFSGPHFQPLYLNVVNEPSSTDHNDPQNKAEKLLQKRREENDKEENFDRDPPLERSKFRPSKIASGKHSSAQHGVSNGGSEAYEKTVAKHGDRIFQKFKKVLSRCPNQVLRYCWKGEPLLISNKQQTIRHGGVTCKSCGTPSVFEFQLMPPLVYILQQTNPDLATGSGVEFGTVLVYSCSESCWNDINGEGGFKEETVFVVADPDQNDVLRSISLQCR